MNKLLSTLLLTACCMTAAADNEQVVTVNGEKLSQEVTKLTFSGDNVVLTFSNGTTETVDMENVTIAFTYTDAVKALSVVKDAETLYFDLNGRQLKAAPKKGAYMIKKGDKVVKLLTK